MYQHSKRLLLVLLVIIMTMILTGCGGPEGTYNQAENLLAKGKYAEAAETLESINAYSDATTFAMYCRACAQAEAGDYETAVVAFSVLGNYRDSALRSVYCLARIGEKEAAAADILALQETKALYDSIPLFLDSTERSVALNARLQEAQYLVAIEAGEKGDYETAFSMFKGLSGYNDSEKRIQYYEARQAEDALGETTTEQALLAAADRYAQMGDYLDCADRAADLQQWARWSLGADGCIWDDDGRVFRIIKGEKWGLINEKGKVISELQWDDAHYFTEGYLAVKKGTKWGFIDTAGNVIIEPQWDDAYPFSEGYAAVKKGTKWGFIDTAGNVISEPQWDGVYWSAATYIGSTGGRFCEGLAPVKKGEKWGFIDTTGKVIIEPKWRYVSDFSEGHATVSYDYETYGYIDTTGKIVIDLIWSAAGNFCEGFARVMNDEGKWGHIDKTGKIISEPQWDDFDDFCDGIAWVKKDDKWGFINVNGEIICAPQWNISFSCFDEGLACGWSPKNGQYGYIDTSGKVIVEPQWDDAKPFSGGFARVCTYKMSDLKTDESAANWGFIDATGKVIIEPQWKSASDFSCGLAAVKKNGKYGYIDTAGRVVIEPQWDLAYDFVNGIAEVKKDGKYGLIDIKGQLITEIQWDSADTLHYLYSHPTNAVAVKKDGKWGLINSSGEIIYGFGVIGR